ncbi:MAG: UvrD-helicase domain-containing protein, partial [Oscillospiraceae bacterium]|nr:UvrD-helicase domain-containing protein [Oscillospiraceae bacterium]
MPNPKLSRRFLELRRAVIEREYKTLNPEQRRAVMTTEGPLLLLAGAGSGKTTVLVHRISNLLKFGRGGDGGELPPFVTDDDVLFLEQYEKNPRREDQERANRLCALDPPAPFQILAITFTNKAAAELKERLERMLGHAALDIWAFTFHAACVRILRREIDRLGFSHHFTIYDTDDSIRLMKDVLKSLNLDDKQYPPRTMLGYLSRAKDALKSPEEYMEECKRGGDFRHLKIAEIYEEYQKRLRASDALDFDDLIYDTVLLLRQFEDVRTYYQKKFRYILIDEYQDTNNLQYLLAALLAGHWKNICVVGDDDQSIYRFRGATIENILSFEKQYKGAKVIRLEQNYRSSGTILEAANHVICNNQGRKGKTLWTEKNLGEKIVLHTALDQVDEAHYVANMILNGYAQKKSWRDYAVLYRMNALSSQFEYAFKRSGVPYRIFGGTGFFDRAEVKDMVSYLCVIANFADDLRLRRIINHPPRGIGPKTVETAVRIAEGEGLPLWEILKHARHYPELAKAAPRF